MGRLKDELRKKMEDYQNVDSDIPPNINVNHCTADELSNLLSNLEYNVDDDLETAEGARSEARLITNATVLEEIPQYIESDPINCGWSLSRLFNESASAFEDIVNNAKEVASMTEHTKEELIAIIESAF